VPKFVDGMVEHIDRIKAFGDVSRPSFRFVDLNKCEKYVKFIALLDPSGAPQQASISARAAL
jgi:hypothetical protein